MALSSWFKRRSSADPAPPPRLVEIQSRLADLETAFDALSARLTDALKGINARITNGLRKGLQDGPESSGEAPRSDDRPHVGYGHPQLPLPERRVRRNY